MAKVKFIGDPNGREHRDAIEHAGVLLPLGKFVPMPDVLARKLADNPHFEVADLPALPKESGPKSAKEDAAAAKRIAELEKQLAEKQAEIESRGEMLQAAADRIAELEAELAKKAG